MLEPIPSNTGTDCSRLDVIEPHVAIEDIVPLAVAVGAAYQGARSRRQNDQSGFCYFSMFDRSEEQFGRSYYLSGSIGRVSMDHWRMSVSILDWDLGEEYLNSNFRELYKFDWLADCSRQAWYKRTRNEAISDNQSLHIIEVSRPIEPIDCRELIGVIEGTLIRAQSNC